VKGISVRYESGHGLDRIDFCLAPGEKVLVVGPNGSGKSTLLKCINGLVVPEKGSIVLAGKEITSMPTYQRRLSGIAAVLENGRVFRNLTVEENLMVGTGKCKRGRSVSKITHVIDGLAVELKEKLLVLAGDLSGGEQRLLAFARSLLIPANFLLVDDVSMGLSELVGERVRSFLFSEEMTQIGIIIVDHDYQSLLSRVDRIVVLAEGRMIGELVGGKEGLSSDLSFLMGREMRRGSPPPPRAC